MSAGAIATIRLKAAVPQLTVFSTEPPPVFAIASRDDVEVFFSRADTSDVHHIRAEGANDVYIHVAGVDAWQRSCAVGVPIFSMVRKIGCMRNASWW